MSFRDLFKRSSQIVSFDFTIMAISIFDTHVFAEYTVETLCQQCIEVAFAPNNTAHQKFKHEYILGDTLAKVLQNKL